MTSSTTTPEFALLLETIATSISVKGALERYEEQMFKADLLFHTKRWSDVTAQAFAEQCKKLVLDGNAASKLICIYESYLQGHRLVLENKYVPRDTDTH